MKDFCFFYNIIRYYIGTFVQYPFTTMELLTLTPFGIWGSDQVHTIEEMAPEGYTPREALSLPSSLAHFDWGVRVRQHLQSYK